MTTGRECEDDPGAAAGGGAAAAAARHQMGQATTHCFIDYLPTATNSSKRISL